MEKRNLGRNFLLRGRTFPEITGAELAQKRRIKKMFAIFAKPQIS